MRKLLFICAIWVSLSAFGIEADYRFSVRGGWILNDGKVEEIAPKRLPDMGAELAVTFHPDWEALASWNRAGIGVACSYWYMGDRKLGHAFAPYAFMDIPFVHLPHFVLGIRPGIGAAFMSKTFYNTLTVPTDELKDFSLRGSGTTYSIGSVFNFYFPEALYMDFPIRDGWALTLAGGWYHISNGSIRQPNSGYNTFSAELGVRYAPSAASAARTESTHPEATPASRPTLLPRGLELSLTATGGGRQVYYKDQRTFGVATIEAAAYWRAHSIFRLGGGIDVFYDDAYRGYPTLYKKTAQHLARPSDCWRVGISLQPEFVVGHFVAGFHVGAYLHDPVRNLEAEAGSPDYETLWVAKQRLNKPMFYRYNLLQAGSAGYPDGWLYTAIVLRYHLPYHLQLQAEMKAHLTKVEFVSVGIGTYL